MDNMKKVIQTYFYVLSGSIISAAIFMTIFLQDAYFNVEVIWQVIIMAAATSMGILIFQSKREISKKQMILRQIIHYAYINVVVLSCAMLWRWVDIHQITQIIALILLVAGVYFSVTTAMFSNEKRIAESINQRLRSKYPEEDKTEDNKTKDMTDEDKSE
jgi:predicted neutral ceramidase superfamily lipid hydrolase